MTRSRVRFGLILCLNWVLLEKFRIHVLRISLWSSTIYKALICINIIVVVRCPFLQLLSSSKSFLVRARMLFTLSSDCWHANTSQGFVWAFQFDKYALVRIKASRSILHCWSPICSYTRMSYNVIKKLLIKTGNAKLRKPWQVSFKKQDFSFYSENMKLQLRRST